MDTITRPQVGLDERYSEPGTVATPWSEARQALRDAQVYWVATVRPDGGPHVTPLIAVWVDGAAYFCTGPDEVKARNLGDQPACTLTTGCNELEAGLDIVVEGVAEPCTRHELLGPIAEHYLDKYGSDWAFEVHDGAFRHVAGGRALVFELAPSVAFAFARGPYSQTRYRF